MTNHVVSILCTIPVYIFMSSPYLIFSVLSSNIQIFLYVEGGCEHTGTILTFF